MIKIKSILLKLSIVFLLVLFLPILFNINKAEAEAHTTKIYASKDKFVDNSGAYDYWGSSVGKTLYVGKFVVPNFGLTQSVLGFSIPTLPDNVKSIKLYMNGYSADNCRITVYGSETDSWSETSTAIPSKDVEITSNIGVGTGWSNSIDITSFILDQYNGDKYASLVLSPTNTASHNTFAFYASEHSGACPFLLVTYTIPSLDTQPNQSITEDNIDEMDINITIEDDTFASSTLNTSMFTLDGEAAANGLSVDSVTYIDSTHATLKLSHDGRDYDDHFKFQVEIDSSQLSSASTLKSNDISVHATDEIDSGGIYDLDNIGPNPYIIISTTEKVTLTQTSHTALNNVIITCSVSGVDLEVDSVNIDNTNFSSTHTIGFMGSSNTLTISGNNAIKSYNILYHAGSPAILVDSSTALNINGSGSLDIYGGNNSAAIGSGESQRFGTININSGTITATGGRYGASIGGGYKSLGGGIINISGGTLNITGGDLAAGIGGGNEGSVGTINISGGTITAIGGWISAGIGGGFKSSGGIINISGGLVYANRTNDANDIGNGKDGSGCQVSITGSSVVFLYTGSLASHPSNDITLPYYNSEKITNNMAYGYSVPSYWTNGYWAYAYITDIVFVSGVSFSPDSHTLVLSDGDISNDTVTLIPTISPSNATDKSVSYSSSDTLVATVDSSGVVTAVKAGNAIITATANDDGGVTGTCTINVEQKVSGVSLVPESATLILGDVDISNDTVTVTPTILPSDATDKTVSYTSSDTSVATVDSLGVVTAVKAGNATITVTTTDGSLTDICVITVEQKVTGVTVLPLTSTLVLGDGNTSNNSINLSATVLPDDADNKSVTWSSLDTSVATVDTLGVVTAVSAGTTTITVTTTDGSFTDTCAITVEQKLSEVSLSPASKTLVLGDADISNDTVSLTPTISPSDATDKTVSYESSDISVATVDTSGVVTAIKAGTTTITATANDGSGKTGTCTITVEQKVIGVSVSPASYTLILGDVDISNDTISLTPTISPSDASDKTVSYKSFDTSVATVDTFGVVTAVKAGNTTITVTTTDGSFTDTCDIIVEQRVTQITSSTKYVSLNKGITCYLIDLLPYTILPSDATNQSVTFAISDSSIATVDNINGTITALNEGLAEITVTSVENPLYTYSWIINVSATASDHLSKSGKLEGKLLDSDGKPMVGYHVTLFSTPRTEITDSNGVFSFDNIPYSEHTLVINDPSFSRFIKYSINFNQTNRTKTEFDNTSKQITLNYSPNTSTFDITFQADSGLSSFDVLSLNFLDVLNTKYSKIVKNPETGYWS